MRSRKQLVMHAIQKYSDATYVCMLFSLSRYVEDYRKNVLISVSFELHLNLNYILVLRHQISVA